MGVPWLSGTKTIIFWKKNNWQIVIYTRKSNQILVVKKKIKSDLRDELNLLRT